jgi:putative transcriptional regulator
MTIVRRSLREIIKSKPKADLHRIRDTTDAEIDAMIASDPDTPPEMTLDLDWRKVISPHVPDIRTLRRKLGLSQSKFASKFGFSVRTVQEWEQGRAFPDRPARILLRVIEKSPKAVERAIADEYPQSRPLLRRNRVTARGA